MIANDQSYKPSIEFYKDPAMGLCVVVTRADGRQVTKQYLTPADLRAWLRSWTQEEGAA